MSYNHLAGSQNSNCSVSYHGIENTDSTTPLPELELGLRARGREAICLTLGEAENKTAPSFDERQGRLIGKLHPILSEPEADTKALHSCS